MISPPLQPVRRHIAAACAGLVLLLVLFIPAHAQERATDIRGIVIDAESGERLPFANVRVAGRDQGTSSNSEGHFFLPGVTGDSCTLVATYVGYGPRDVRVDMTDAVPRLEIPLLPVSIALRGVTVTASPLMLETATTLSHVTLSPRALGVLPAIGQTDVFRALQLLPGINAGSSGSSELHVRGGTPDQNLILFDGMTMYHVDHFFGFFSAFNPDAIKDIQAFTGGYTAEYGGRLSSVISMTGKTGSSAATNLGVGLNLLSANAVLEGPLPFLGDATYLVAGRRSFTDFIRSGLYEDLYNFVTGDETGGRVGSGVRPSGGGGPGSGRPAMTGSFIPSFYFYDINAKLTVRPTSRDAVSLSFYSGKDDLDKSQVFTGSVFNVRELEGQASLSITDYTRWANTGLSGMWNRQWSERVSSLMSIAASEFTSNYNRGTNTNLLFAPSDSTGMRRGLLLATQEDNSVRDFTMRGDVKWQTEGDHRLDGGFTSSRFAADYVASASDSADLLRRGGSSWMFALYVQDTWKLGALESTIGLRGTWYEGTDRVYIEPRLSLQYALGRGFSLRGAWGLYHQFVNRVTNENVLEGSREFWLTADADIPPGAAEHRILGVAYTADEYTFSVEAYEKHLENLTEYSRRFRAQADFANFFFFGTGTARGLEVLAQKTRGALSGWIGYTLARVEHTFPSLNGGTPFPASHDHLHNVKSVLTWNVSGWTFSASWVYSSGNAVTVPESQYFLEMLNGQQLGYIHVSGKNASRLPAYHQLDLSVTRSFELALLRADFGVSVFNVYNRKNISYREYNLTTTPITITDVALLGFTPSVNLALHF
ncbi:MAG: TonB-dependent receptor [Ignavibacteriae bacterium]|nr:TonB-dependent receptor [Ignavibacteriota bacterium]